MNEYKIKINNRNTRVSPLNLEGQWEVKLGDYVIINSSRIYSDALLPALFLGLCPKDNSKGVYLVSPYLYRHNLPFENNFAIVVSKSTRSIKVQWESQNANINRVFYKAQQCILTKDSLVDLDKIIKNYEQI